MRTIHCQISCSLKRDNDVRSAERLCRFQNRIVLADAALIVVNSVDKNCLLPGICAITCMRVRFYAITRCCVIAGTLAIAK